MKLNILLNGSEKEKYFYILNKYLKEQEEKCKQNLNNTYFKITLEHIKEIKEFIKNKFSASSPQNNFFDNKATKYIDFVESYRLIRFQYSKYSNLKKSYTEAVYSAIPLQIVKLMKENIKAPLEIMDVGSGPSRIAFELSEIFPKSKIELYDFSVINLFFAYKLLNSEAILKIPYRILSDINSISANSDIGLMEIKSKIVKNISFNLCDLSSDFMINKKYDIINMTHSLNLLNDPKKTIDRLVSKLKKDGILIVSDLLGWKEDRELKRRILSDGKSFYNFFEKNKDLRIIEYWYGGPYCEEFNSERFDFYINHSIILKKI